MKEGKPQRLSFLRKIGTSSSVEKERARKNNGILEYTSGMGSELASTRKRWTEATEHSGPSADLEFRVMPSSVALCVPFRAQPLCRSTGRGYSIYQDESLEGRDAA